MMRILANDALVGVRDPWIMVTSNQKGEHTRHL
jgi:hypothetical protein